MSPKLIGNLLVSAQFGTLVVLALQAWSTWQASSSHLVIWLLLGLSGAVGVWALSANRPGNFNVHPTPHQSGQLVDHGPYRWIRHPMYTAVLLFGAAMAAAISSVNAWLLWILLAGALLSKALLEERWMTQKHPAYAAYRARTRRFVPYLL